MTWWIDAQLPPSLAPWLTSTFGIEARSLRELGLRDASDRQIFDAAKAASAIIISKDSAFITHIEQLGIPPQLLWVTCGNVSNDRLIELFTSIFPTARGLIEAGEPIVEMGS
jgi:predicted nuclease of predicted toxin-antitoxin system